MKKAIIFYLWGRKNAGDMAICLGAIALLQENGYEITFVSRFTEDQNDYLDSKQYIEKYFENVEIKPGIFKLDRTDSNLNLMKNYIRGGIKLISPKKDKELEEVIANKDLVFLNGGNLLRGNSFSDYARLAALFYPFNLSKKLNKKIISLPQSTATSSKFGQYLLNKNLEKFDSIFMRETQSYTALKNEVDNVDFYNTTDMAFYIKDNEKAEKEFRNKYYRTFDKDRKNIAIIVRGSTIGDLEEFNSEKKETIATNIINYINEFSSHYDFYFIIQTQKDKQFTENIVSNKTLKTKPIIIEEYDTLVLREIYKKMDFTVAMRLHAAILSMNVGTPVVGYFDEEWGYKNPGIMDDINMPWTFEGKELKFLSKKVIEDPNYYKMNIEKFIAFEKRKISSEL